MKRLGAFGIVVLALLAPVVVAAPAGAASRHSSEWNDLQRKIRDTQQRIREARAREAGIIAQINASDLRRQRLESALAALGVELADAGTQLEALQKQLLATQLQLDSRTRDLTEALALLDEQKQVMTSRAAEKYMEGPMAFAPVLLNSSDFTTFVVGDTYVESVLQDDVHVIDQVRSLRDQIQSQRSALDAHKTEISVQVLTIAHQRDQIAAIRDRQASAKRAVVGEINYRKSLLSKVQDQRKAWEDALASYKRESDSLAGILHNYQKGQHVVAGAGKGYLVWPVTGRISSPYGWRIHPIFHTRSFHTGIDIASPAGSHIAASRAGRVVYTGYKGAYGLIVVIDHGDSVATVYAHMSKVGVSVGQKVKKGQTIGLVGCTGWCTGPHVHFEVRVEGQPTNPVRWL